MDARRTLTTRIWESENGNRRFRTDVYNATGITTTWDPGPDGRQVVTTSAPDGALDPLTVLMLLRGQPLLDGDVYNVPIFSKDAVYKGQVRVVGREQMKVLGAQTPVIHLRSTFERHGKVSRVYADIWLTDDARRLPAMVDAGTSYGRLKSELTAAHNVPGG